MVLLGRPFQILALVVVTGVIFAGMAAVRSYRNACLTAERTVNAAGDGPWTRTNTRFVMNYSAIGRSGTLPPHWMFRFQNLQTDTFSKRVYVSFSGNQAFDYNQAPDADDLRSILTSEHK
jgi:hypothetical protein